MIMQGTTPRGLSWTGLLGMIGLAALLLPLSPTWAQKADDDERSEKNRDVREDAEDSEIGVIERKLAEEIRRVQALEARIQEKARAWAKQERERSRRARSESSDEAKKADEDRDSADRDHKEKEKEKDRPKERRVEAKVERISPRARTFKYYHENDLAERSADVRARLDGLDVDKELARARIEVERARAQLRQAELQLAKLGAELKVRENSTARRPLESKAKAEMRAKDSLKFNVKPDIQLHDFKLEFKKELLEKLEKPEGDRQIEGSLKFDAERHREAAKRIVKKLKSSPPDHPGKIEEHEALREGLDEYKKLLHDFDHDSAARMSTHVKDLEKAVEQLKSLNKEKHANAALGDSTRKLESLIDMLKRLNASDEKPPEPESDESR